MQQIVFEERTAGQSINRWNLSAPASELFPGEARPMADRVDYRFQNGWVDTGDLPCREAWRKVVADRTITLEERTFPNVHCGFENPRVDFSRFCFQPTVISRWARCILKLESAQTLHLKATTCGGMHVWSDQTLKLIHEPYTRNTPSSTEFELAFESGDHAITVYFDDLHERDTSCFFELQLLDGKGIQAGLLTSSDIQRLTDVERMMSGLRTDKIFYNCDMLRITSDFLPPEPVELTLLDVDTLLPPEAVSASLVMRHPPRRISVLLGRASPIANVMNTSELVSGCPELVWQCTVGDVTVQRKIGTSVLNQPVDLTTTSGNDRREVFLHTLASSGMDCPAYLLVMLRLGQWNDHAQSNFDKLLKIANARDDCADFHMMTLVWIASHYVSCLSSDNQKQLKNTLLAFRYWLDEPGNDVMWFWSENHVLCFHVAQYIAGDIYNDHQFINSGKFGRKHAQQALDRLHRWFDSVDEHGLSEWNSAAYYPIDFRALLTLYAAAKDPGIVKRAGSIMDRIFKMVALHTISFVPAGSQGRAYEKEILAGPATELGAVAALAFGGAWYMGHDTAAAMLAVSDYSVPADLDRLLQVESGQGLITSYFQGLDNNADLYLWKTANTQLSTVCNHKTGVPGHQQHLLDFQFADHPHARIWINHPGELRVWGDGRPSYWAGNGFLPRVAQYEDCAIMIYDLTKNDNGIEFTHLFCPRDAMDEINVSHAHWLFARVGSGFAAVYCSGTFEPVTTGLYSGSEWRVNEKIVAWIVITGSEFEYENMSIFKNACLARQVVFCADQKNVSVLARNRVDQLSLSFSSSLCLNGSTIENCGKSGIPEARFLPLLKYETTVKD